MRSVPPLCVDLRQSPPPELDRRRPRVSPSPLAALGETQRRRGGVVTNRPVESAVQWGPHPSQGRGVVAISTEEPNHTGRDLDNSSSLEHLADRAAHVSRGYLQPAVARQLYARHIGSTTPLLPRDNLDKLGGA